MVVGARSSLYGRGIVNFANNCLLRSHIPLRSCLVGLRLWSDNVNWNSCIVTTYNPHTMFIARVANRHWHFLQSKERLAHISRERPLIAYRRPKSLRNILASTSLKTKTLDNHSSTRGGCGPCNKPRSRLCNHINKAPTFIGIKNCKGYRLGYTPLSGLSIFLGHLHYWMQYLQVTACWKDRDTL